MSKEENNNNDIPLEQRRPSRFVKRGLSSVSTKALSWWGVFRRFILKGNVVDVAIGVIVGQAFQRLITSLNTDILMPPIGLLVGSNLQNWFYIIQDPPARTSANGTVTRVNPDSLYTIEDAQAAGAVTINVGRFFQGVITFILLCLTLFAILKLAFFIGQRSKRAFFKAEEEIKEEEWRCPYCCEVVDEKATRCKFCTSHIKSALEIEYVLDDTDDDEDKPDKNKAKNDDDNKDDNDDNDDAKKVKKHRKSTSSKKTDVTVGLITAAEETAADHAADEQQPAE